MYNKTQALQEVVQEIEKCRRCKKHAVGKAVPGEGNPNARVMFVGEAPGRQESMTGRPFIGRSGKLLRHLIQEVGLREEDVYITSPVKYLPVYKTPKLQDIMHGKEHFDKQVNIINPKIIVLLGAVAMQAVLGEKIPVLKVHGTIREKNGKKYFLTIHPAAALRVPPLQKTLQEDFHKLQSMLAK
jgi:DNA polymerase